MENQYQMNFAAPHASMVLTIGEIISPAVISTVSGVAFLVRKAWALATRKSAKSGTVSVAPHVALVSVPGSYLSDAFKRY